jgi:hypothetical protein
MMRVRRSGLVLSAASAICLLTALAGGAAASPAGGVKGDPQPELTPFKIGNLSSTSPGSIAMEPNGSLVAVYDVPGGNGQLQVCVLDRGARGCAGKIDLSALSDDDTFGTPEVFIPSANHVVVLQGACCDRNSNGPDLLFSSTDGGKTFGPPVRIGGLGVAAAALAGDQIVFTAQDDSSGSEVESVSVNSPVSTPITVVNSKKAYDVGVGSYHGGALLSSDSAGPSFYTTYVEYAKSGANFNAASSYKAVGSFGKEILLGMSGSALLTIQTDGHTTVELRLFNGTSFSSARSVPGTSGGGPEWFGVEQDPSGAVHVFSERGLDSPGYHLIEESTSNGGKTWSGPVDLGDAIGDSGFAAALDSHGAGLVLGTGAPKGYPVLESQNVSFSLSSTHIRKGKSTTGSGKGSPGSAGRTVVLQVERSSKWYTVATAHEHSGGSFSFTIKGSSAGTFRYRAVVSDLAGYLMYGYSNAKSLSVTG